MAEVRKRDCFQKQRPTTELMSIHLLNDDVSSGKIYMNPPYQRSITWCLSQMVGLVGAVMYNMLIPNIILYKYQDADEKADPRHEYESIDGQHRLFTFFHFRHGIPVDETGSLIYWLFEKNDVKVYVFFEENEHTRNWETKNPGKSMGYMSKEEQRDFDRFALNVTSITSPLTFEQRCAQFRALQNGTPVRNSDYHKNEMSIPVIAYIMENRFETVYRNSIARRLTVKHNKYWLMKVLRFFLISSAIDSKKMISSAIDSEEIISSAIKKEMIRWFNCTDRDITHMIKSRSTRFTDVNQAQLEKFKNDLVSFVDHVDKLGVCKITPVQLSAMYHMFVVNDSTFSEDDLEFQKHWCGTVQSKNEEKMWEQGFNCKITGETAKETRQAYFERCLNELTKKIRRETPLRNAVLRHVTKRMKEAVWRRSSKDENGKCSICNKEIHKSNWHCGHIQSLAMGGPNELDNLIAECAECNLAHGTENAFEYKKRVYPDKLEELED